MHSSMHYIASCQRTILCLVVAVTCVAADVCDDGRMCQYPDQCCDTHCCAAPNYHDAYRSFKWSVWNMWYFWFIVIFVLMSCFGGCGYLRRRQLVMSRRMSPADFTTVHMNGPLGFFAQRGPRQPASSASSYSPSITIPVFFSREHVAARQGGHRGRGLRDPSQATTCPTPPSYSEVISKPDSYPINDKNKLPPYPGPTAEGVAASGVTGQSTIHSYDIQPALPPYTPFPENGPNHTGAMPTDPRSTPPPTYGI